MATTEIINAITGLLGLAGQKRDPYKEASANALNRQTSILDAILAMARDYDPAKETKASVDYAGDVAGNALAAMQQLLNQRYKTGGGSPTGDTNFAFEMQRGQDDILGPLMEFAANRKASEFAQKYNAMLGAAGVGRGLSQDWQSLGRYSQQTKPDYSGSQAMLAQSIGSLLGGSQPRDYSGYTSQQPFTVGPSPEEAAKKVARGALGSVRWF